MKNIKIAPSILSANWNDLASDVKKIDDIADFLHFDVMDGIFVPKITFTPKVFKDLKPHHHLINDVHLMVIDPLKQAEDYANVGADFITVHYEAFENDKDILKCIDFIHSKGCKAGLSLKPKTDSALLLPFLDRIDLILVMSVEPGQGGQKYIPESTKRICEFRKFIDEHKLNVLIEVDGGINDETAQLAKKAGADVLVAGSYLFGHEDIRDRLFKLK